MFAEELLIIYVLLVILVGTYSDITV